MLLLIGLAFSMATGLGQTPLTTGVVHAANPPICVLLGQGERACPSPDESNDPTGKPAFPAKNDHCYYFDPGNATAGSIKGYPGWQEITCDSKLFKEGLCVTGKQPQSPACQRIGYTQDEALNCGDKGCDIVSFYLEPAINILAALVGIVVTISIIVGGIQYASSADDPQKVSQAKGRITKSLVALVSFFFLYVFLQWIMPGGFL